jgi:hypothetical protein
MSQNEIILETKREIAKLKDKLEKSDYQAIKFAEGLISEEEYAPVKAQRQTWRDEINKLEEELKELKSQEA